MPVTRPETSYFFEGFGLVQTAEARLLDAFVAACPLLQTWPLVDAYRALLAAWAVLARSATDADGPGPGLQAGAGRPARSGPAHLLSP